MIIAALARTYLVAVLRGSAGDEEARVALAAWVAAADQRVGSEALRQAWRSEISAAARYLRAGALRHSSAELAPLMVRWNATIVAMEAVDPAIARFARVLQGSLCWQLRRRLAADWKLDLQHLSDLFTEIASLSAIPSGSASNGKIHALPAVPRPWLT